MKRKFVRVLLPLILSILVLTTVVLVLFNWRTATRIMLKITVNQVIFTLQGSADAPSDFQALLNTLFFTSVSASNFEQIKFTPLSIAVANPVYYNLEIDKYPKSAWFPLKIESTPVVIEGTDKTLLPTVTLESASKKARKWNLNKLMVEPGSEVIMRLNQSGKSEAYTLTIEIRERNSDVVVSFHEQFYMTANNATLFGIEVFSMPKDYITYKGKLRDNASLIEIAGEARGLILNFSLSLHENNDILTNSCIWGDSLDFTRLDPQGELKSTAVKNSNIIIEYPDYPHIEPKKINCQDYIQLDKRDRFRFEEIRLNPELKGIQLILSGVARSLKTGDKGNSQDHRLTLYQQLRYGQLYVLASAIIWIITAFTCFFRYFKEFRNDFKK